MEYELRVLAGKVNEIITNAGSESCERRRIANYINGW
jgi:hypothetical protein